MSDLALQGGTPVRSEPFPDWPVYGDREQSLLIEAFQSGKWAYQGVQEVAFMKEFAEFQGAPHVHLVNNGSVSLEIALRAFGIGPGDEVIVPALTWTATAWAVIQVGATPIFADSKADDWTIDPASIKEKLTPRTKAIIPVHLYCQMADMDAIMAIAKEHNLRVLEDSAHAHGMAWKGKGAGTIGDIGSFSFQSSKSLTCGEGGALITNDMQLYERMYGLKNCGRALTDGSPTMFGTNYRITEFQAAVLRGQLERMPEQIAHKKKNVDLFREKIKSVQGVLPTAANPDMTGHGMYALSIRIDQKQFGDVPLPVLVEAMKAEGVPVLPTYEIVYHSVFWTPGEKICRFEDGANAADRLGLKSKCPVAENIAEKEGVKMLHHLFLGGEKELDDMVAAFAKIQANASELKMAALKRKAKSGAKKVLRKLGIKR